MNKVFKSGLGKVCGRQPLKNLLSPVLNAWSHMQYRKKLMGESEEIKEK